MEPEQLRMPKRLWKAKEAKELTESPLSEWRRHKRVVLAKDKVSGMDSWREMSHVYGASTVDL